MRILVTGSLGTIGRHLVPELASRGHEVFGCDLYHHADEHAPHFQNNDATYMRCDVSEYRQVEATLGYFEPEMVYHAAAEFGRWNGEDFYETLWRTNVIGTKHILRLQETMGFRLVHFSSSEVYGNMAAVLHEEFAPVRGLLNDYAMTKWVNEQQIYNTSTDAETVIVRLFNTYGPGERYSPYRSVNCAFLYRAMRGLPLIVHDGHYRTSTFVSDTVRTLANIAEKFSPGMVYNIAGEKEHSIRELAETTLRVMNPKGIYQLAFPESMTAIRKQPDITLAKRELDHRITVDLETGMKLTAEWMRKEYGM